MSKIYVIHPYDAGFDGWKMKISAVKHRDEIQQIIDKENLKPQEFSIIEGSLIKDFNKRLLIK